MKCFLRSSVSITGITAVLLACSLIAVYGQNPVHNPPAGLEQLIYPGCATQIERGSEEQVAARMGRYTTADHPNKVVKWYLDKCSSTSVDFLDGILHKSGGILVAHDERRIGRAGEQDNDSVELDPFAWLLTASLPGENDNTTISVMVTRSDPNSQTSIAVTVITR